MNKTPNYSLNQWEAEDRVLRTDFNADNAKIDAAIATKCEIVTGTYTGDGAAEQEIVLGYKPKVIIVTLEGCEVSSYGCLFGIATPEMPVIFIQKPALVITETGFKVYSHRFEYQSSINLNSENTRYRYVIFC